METQTVTKISVLNPIVNKELYTITEPTDAELQKVFTTAKAIQQKIADMTVQQRISEMLKINDFILANREHIIDRIVEETGKARVDCLVSEVFEVCDVIDHFKKVTAKILKDHNTSTPIFLMGKKSKIVYDPLGTILVIAPSNYPFYQGIVPGLLAFLAGNAVIFKPSEVTPLKGLWEKMIQESGFMKDAFQVVYGGKATGARLIDLKPDKIHFTGSVRAGHKIMEH